MTFRTYNMSKFYGQYSECILTLIINIKILHNFRWMILETFAPNIKNPCYRLIFEIGNINRRAITMRGTKTFLKIYLSRLFSVHRILK